MEMDSLCFKCCVEIPRASDTDVNRFPARLFRGILFPKSGTDCAGYWRVVQPMS